MACGDEQSEACAGLEAQDHRVLVVNPGSTSIKIALYEGVRCIHDEEIAHVIPRMATRPERVEQVEALLSLVRDALARWRSDALDGVAARGGLLPRPDGKLPGGAYVVAERREGGIQVEHDIVAGVLDYPENSHAANLGIPIAAALARELGVPAFCVDPPIIDEFLPRAELSGYAPVLRRSTSHALSVRAAARWAARKLYRPFDEVALVVVHLGGGITVAAVRGGRMVDNNIGLLGGGPFTPQRAGQLPTAGLIDLCYSGRFARAELIEELTKHGGLQSYLGEYRMQEIEPRIAAGDAHARLVVEAMVYQIAKEIGAMFVATDCEAEAIVLTGGLTRSPFVRDLLQESVERLAPVIVFEESLEMPALATGALDVLSGREQPLRYRLPERITASECATH